MLTYKISACEACIIWWKPIGACEIHSQSPSRRLAELWWSRQDINLNYLMVHGATLTPRIQESVYVWSHVGCETLTCDCLTQNICNSFRTRWFLSSMKPLTQICTTFNSLTKQTSLPNFAHLTKSIIHCSISRIYNLCCFLGDSIDTELYWSTMTAWWAM